MNLATIKRLTADEAVGWGKHFPIFPCNNEKRPLTSNGFYDATQDEETIRKWWVKWPDALMGVPTGRASGILILDVDPSALTEDSRSWLQDHTKLLCGTRSQRTRRDDGRHYGFKNPEDMRTRCVAGVAVDGTRLPGIDVRGDGGYTIWWGAHGLKSEGRAIPLPDELLPLFAAPQPSRNSNGIDAGTALNGGAIHEGSRNDYLSRKAYALRKEGSTVEQIEAVLCAINDARCEPPLDADEVGLIARGKAHVEPGPELSLTYRRSSSLATSEKGISDDDLALEFSARYEGQLRYVPNWGAWLIWDGSVWERDEKLTVWDMAREVCRDVLQSEKSKRAITSESQLRQLQLRLGGAGTVAAVVRLASSDPRHAVTPDQLDADPWALNTPGGIVDLRTGTMRPHDPAALLTKITNAIPGGECPQFHRVLERVLPDQEVRGYVQRLMGYALTGVVRDHALPFFYGTGRNGKGTLVHSVRKAMGGYGLEVGAELLMETHNERHLCELAVLQGARLAVGSEIDSGKRWNESRVKRLTGGDPISARFMARDPFEFDPSHKLIILANNKPGLRSVDEAMRARMHLVPFNLTIPEAERDPSLPEKLVGEYGGILAWQLEGCRAWQEQGLAPPETIRAASKAYLDGEDSIAGWMAECCERHGVIKLTDAHSNYRDWCKTAGIVALGRNTFGDQLANHDVARDIEKRGGTTRFTGLQLVSHKAAARGQDDSTREQDDAF